MNTLSDILFSFAMERRIGRFLREDRETLRDERRMVDCALDTLGAAGGESADLVKRVSQGTDALAYLNERAAFLSGLSIGLELAALVR